MFALIQTFSIYFYIYVYDVQVNNHRMLRKISKILLFVCNITVNVQLLPSRATNMNHCYCYIFVPFSILLELFSLFVGVLLHDCINTVEILLRIKWFDDEQNEESTFFSSIWLLVTYYNAASHNIWYKGGMERMQYILSSCAIYDILYCFYFCLAGNHYVLQQQHFDTKNFLIRVMPCLAYIRITS